MNNPFPGPQPYRAADRDRFYGREDLAYALEGSVLASRCVTVHGPSGAGKSSLVQAAVIPALVAQHEVLVVRVDGWPEDEDPTRWFLSAMHASLGLGDPPADRAPDEAVLLAAQRAARRSSRITLVYLDQIEQLLSPGRSAGDSGAFFACVGRLVDLPLRNLRVLLSLREDYLGRFRDRLRDHRRILDHGFRVGPLTVAELTDAVCQAAAAGDPPQRWSPEETRALLLQVRAPGQAPTDDAEAQSAYAQIVCRALFQQRAQGEAAGSSRAPRAPRAPRADEAEPILQSYLEATLEALGPLRAGAQRLLEDHLVSADGSRTLRTEKELLRILPAAELSPILRALEGAAILHAEQRQGSRYFELGHDWLARRVHERRAAREREEEQRRREAEQQAELERQREEAEARLARARAQRRISLIVALVSLAVAAGAGTLGIWAWRQKRAVEAANRKAEDRKHFAEEKQREAHDHRILAGFRELSARQQQAFALKLLPEVQQPAKRRGWIELASDALATNALRVSLRGHEGSLAAAAFSPDGARVLTASSDRTARVWRADGTGLPVVLEGHGAPITAAAFSPDGARVLTASEDGTARVWPADGGGQPVKLDVSEAPVDAAAWSPDGARVITASRDGTARVFAATGGGPLHVLAGHGGPVRSAAFFPDGARALTASEDGTARVWTLAAPVRAVVLKGHEAGVVFAAPSPDGARVLTASRDRTARVWSADGGEGPRKRSPDPRRNDKPVVLAGHKDDVLHAAWSPDGLQVATASADRTARVWSADGKGDPVVLEGHQGSVVHVAFSPDGRSLATASADRTARVWPADGAGPALVLSGHEAPVRSALWSPDGARLVTAAADRSERSLDRTAKVWSVEALASLPRGPGGARTFHAAFLSEDGARVAAASDDSAALVYPARGAGEPAVLRGAEGWVASAALSPDGARVVTASFDGLARVYRADGAGEPVLLRGHAAPVRHAAFSPDGARIVTASQDRTARVWSADGAGEPVVLSGHADWLTSAAWSPDGARVVTTALDHTARVWSADGKAAPLVLAGHRGDVLAAAWSPDGARLVTASEDRTARIWSVAGEGEGPPVVLRGHTGPVLRAVFSADGARVATASADRTVRVWTASGEPFVVLDVQSPVLALRFLFVDGVQKLAAVTQDGATRTWLIDVEVLKERLRTAHADCLPADKRELYLGEPAEAARKAYAACEASFQRAPAAPAPARGKTP